MVHPVQLAIVVKALAIKALVELELVLVTPDMFNRHQILLIHHVIHVLLVTITTVALVNNVLSPVQTVLALLQHVLVALLHWYCKATSVWLSVWQANTNPHKQLAMIVILPVQLATLLEALHV